MTVWPCTMQDEELLSMSESDTENASKCSNQLQLRMNEKFRAALQKEPDAQPCPACVDVGHDPATAFRCIPSN